MNKKSIYTPKAPEPIGPYSQAILKNNTLWASGQVAINPATNEVVLGTIEEEAEQVMKNIQAILEAAEMNFEHIVKTTIFLSDMSLFSKVNEVYGSYFKSNPPARETVAVKGLPKNVNVEISITAVKD